MGFLNLFAKPSAGVQRLPSGTVTVDRHGEIVMTTVASDYSRELLREIAAEVLALFKEAGKSSMPLAELVVEFSSLRITAREMRGGAIIFLSPVSTFATSPPF